MAFSNLVLPNVAPVQQGGPLVNAMQGINSLANNMANTQTAQATAKYAPYNQYATAALNMAQANMLPYQIQAQKYSNPLLMEAMSQLAKTDPDAYKNYMVGLQNFGTNIPQGNALFGNMPAPGQQQNGLLNLLINKITGNSSSQNAIQQPNTSGFGGNAMQNPQMSSSTNMATSSGQQPNTVPQTQGDQPQTTQGTPILPASRDDAIIGTATAQYNQSPFKAGDLIWDSKNNKVISNATGSVVQQAQQGLSGLQRIDPLIRRLAVEQFPEQSGWTSLLSDIEGVQNRWGPKALNNLFPQIENQYPDIAKQFNLTGLALPTLKARADSDLATAPEQLIRIYGLKPGKYTIQELSKILEPVKDETGDQYTQRLMEKISQMQQEEGAPYKTQLSQGFDVSNPNQGASTQAQAPSAAQAGQQVSNSGSAPTFDSGKFLDQKFKNSDEFKQAFNSYNAQIKQMIVNEMNKRGWH